MYTVHICIGENPEKTINFNSPVPAVKCAALAYNTCMYDDFATVFVTNNDYELGDREYTTWADGQFEYSVFLGIIDIDGYPKYLKNSNIYELIADINEIMDDMDSDFYHVIFIDNMAINGNMIYENGKWLL